MVDWIQWSGVPILAGDPAVDRMPGRLRGESLDRLGNATFRLGLQSQEQSQEQHIQLHEDQLITDTADLKMTEDALAEDTAALEDTTQYCLVCQTKVADFKACNKSLSEDLEAFAKARAVISEKTGRSVLSSRGGLAREPKGEHSIELAQLASPVDSAMHAEISNGNDNFAKVKGFISDMGTRLEEKAFKDTTHKATSNVYTVVHRTDWLKTIVKRVHGVSQLFSFFNETYYPEDMHAIITVLKEDGVKSTSTPAQLTVDGKVSEAFARTKLFMQQHKSSETSMISLGSGIMKLNSVVYPASHIWPEVMNIMLKNDMKIKWIDDSQGVTLEKFMRVEMVAVKSCKSLVYSGWNDWQNIIIEIEYGDTGMDKADENSQYLETYDAMRKTTESECEAKDPIKEQINKYTRNGGRRYQEPSEISTDPKAEISREKMLQTKAIRWNQNQTPDAREGASSQRRMRSAGASPGAQQQEREEGERRIDGICNKI